jgi:Type II intron maturase/Reverse transcriptase (RNA-dependent DNA polymerase)
MIKSINKRFHDCFENVIKNSVSNVSEVLRYLYPEKDGVYTKILSRFIANPAFLKLSYTLINNNRSYSIFGNTHDQVILDGFSNDWFQKAALDLKRGIYKIKDSRSVYIYKKGTPSAKLLIISDFTDKIIKKAIQLVFEEIYEHKENFFLRFSHGFRYNKSVHTAFKQIKNEWVSVPWFITIEIKEVFSAINRNILISRLQLKIKDQLLLDLILKMFKANILSLVGLLKKKVEVCPDYILSPILVNIYFHELDVFAKKHIMERYKKGIKPTTGPNHQRALFFIHLEKKASLTLQNVSRRKRKEVCGGTAIASKYIRINYLRYLNDILIGVRGPRILAEKILKTFSFFFKSNLQLSLDKEKSQILNSFSSKISFLGMLLYNTLVAKTSHRRNREIENKKLKSLRVLSRLKALKYKQTKFFKDKCLATLRKSYNKCRNNKVMIKKDFILTVENSIIFKNLLDKPNRFIYREFLKNLQWFTDIEENNKLVDFLKLWEQEISGSKNNLCYTNLRLVTKKETISRIVTTLKEKYNLPVYERELFDTFKSSENEWIPLWDENFCLSQGTVHKLRYMKNGVYNSRLNSENIYLVVKDLIFHVNSLFKNRGSIVIANASFKNVKSCWGGKKLSTGLSILIKADINEIYKRLITNSIVNSKKRPRSKTSFIRFDAWSIIEYYNLIARGLLFYFCGADNVHAIKKIVEYPIRQSLLRTLAHKHKCSSVKILNFYSKEIKIANKCGKEISYINPVEVLSLKKDFLTKHRFEFLW